MTGETNIEVEVEGSPIEAKIRGRVRTFFNNDLLEIPTRHKALYPK